MASEESPDAEKNEINRVAAPTVGYLLRPQSFSLTLIFSPFRPVVHALADLRIETWVK
jgi:hypothetical protein